MSKVPLILNCACYSVQKNNQIHNLHRPRVLKMYLIHSRKAAHAATQAAVTIHIMLTCKQ